MPGTFQAVFFQSSSYLALFADVVWGLLAVVVFFIGVLLVTIILIQDSKDSGLTSAFGSGGGGSALLGARMQKGLTRLTTVLAIVFAVSVLIMGLIGNSTRDRSISESVEPPAPAAGEGPAGGVAPIVVPIGGADPGGADPGGAAPKDE